MYGGYNVVVEIRTATSRDLHLAPPCQPPPRSTRAIHDDVETAAALLSLACRGDAASKETLTPPGPFLPRYTLETRSRRHE